MFEAFHSIPGSVFCIPMYRRIGGPQGLPSLTNLFLAQETQLWKETIGHIQGQQ